VLISEGRKKLVPDQEEREFALSPFGPSIDWTVPILNSEAQPSVPISLLTNLSRHSSINAPRNDKVKFKSYIILSVNIQKQNLKKYSTTPLLHLKYEFSSLIATN
jgi:hypothetical protein